MSLFNSDKMSERVEVVSGNFLRDLFSSESFIEINKEAAEETRKSSRETAYFITKGYDNDNPSDVSISDIIIGKNSRTDISQFTYEALPTFFRKKEQYPLILSHYHPGDFIPSPRDFKMTNKHFCTSGIPTINIVGESPKEDLAELLLYQQQRSWGLKGIIVPGFSYKKFRRSLDERVKSMLEKSGKLTGELSFEDIVAVNDMSTDEIEKLGNGTYKAHILYILRDEIGPLKSVEKFAFTMPYR